MCVLLKYLFFDFASENTLKDRANLLGFFSALTDAGEFHLVDPAESLESAWSSALQRGLRNAWLRFENAAKLNLTFGLYAGNWQRLYIVVYEAAISNAVNLENIRSLVQAGELVYNTLHPEYGYGLIALENQLLGAPGEEELKAIYDYNFFSPRLVQQIGQEKLLGVPTHRSVEFEDGGMLLEMSPTPLLNRKTYALNYKETAQILGISNYYQGGT